MDCQGFPTESYAMYVLGALEPAESSTIYEHLGRACAVCMAGLRDAQRVWLAVGAATASVKPSRALRRKVVQSVGSSSISWWWQPLPAMAGVGLLVLASAGGWYAAGRRADIPQISFAPAYPPSVTVVSPSSEQPPAQTAAKTVVKEVPTQVTKEITKEVPTPDPAVVQALAQERQKTAQLQAELLAANAQNQKPVSDALNQSDLQQRLAAAATRSQELERQVAQYRVLFEAQRKRADQNLQLASMVSDPSLRVLRLRGTEKGGGIQGHALIAGNGQMQFYASNLPALPPNRTYQLWLIRASGTAIASAGLFNPDAGGAGSVKLNDRALLSSVTTLAVTDEPAGGSVQPTGHKWMIGI